MGLLVRFSLHRLIDITGPRRALLMSQVHMQGISRHLVIHSLIIHTPVLRPSQCVVVHVLGPDQALVGHPDIGRGVPTHLHQTGVAIDIGSHRSISRGLDDGHRSQVRFANPCGLAGLRQGKLSGRISSNIVQAYLGLTQPMSPAHLPNEALSRDLFRAHLLERWADILGRHRLMTRDLIAQEGVAVAGGAWSGLTSAPSRDL